MRLAILTLGSTGDVIISHGEPLHDRAAFEGALDLPPWSDDAG